MTDKWAGYNELNYLGYYHDTVNHSENYVYPDSSSHTQEIEGGWNGIKRIYKHMQGNRKHLQSRTDEALWRIIRTYAKNQGRLFEEFLVDVCEVDGALTCR